MHVMKNNSCQLLVILVFLFSSQMAVIGTASIMHDVGINIYSYAFYLECYDIELVLNLLNLKLNWPIYVVKWLLHNLANTNMFINLVVNRNLFYIELVIPFLYLNKKLLY